MTTEQFQAEKNYRVSIAIGKAMLAKRIITEQEYAKYDTMMLDKYHPIIGELTR